MRLLNCIKNLKFIQTSYQLLFVVSLLGFLWHFYGSISAYLEYGTKVTFAIEDPKDYKYEYPGITVCFRSVIPYYRLIEKYPELAEDVVSVVQEINVRNDSVFWIKSISNNYTKSKQTGRGLKDFYENKLKDELPIYDVLEEWGVNIGIRCRVYSYPLIDKSFKNCEDIAPIIETINYKFRCFTFFTQLFIGNNSKSLFTTTVVNNDLESYNENMAHIALETNLSTPLHPFDNNFNVRLTIHPPQMIPLQTPQIPHFYRSKRLSNNWGRHYDVLFSKTVSHLLEPPYQTNCKFYDLQSDIQSYDKCLSVCVLNAYRELCNCLPRLGVMYSKTDLRSDDRFCETYTRCQTLHIRENCAKNCKPDCVQEQYDAEIISDIKWLDLKNASAIKVGRKPIPDNVFRHSVSISWVQLVSDIGGLGGLWLGLSVISVAKVIICWIKNIKIKDQIPELEITKI